MINRQNYEEFFLLYADKELEADARAAVEIFVRQNPDLAKELEMLQQAILIDDNTQFEQKELLYKHENGISFANYEEYFLLAADNELTMEQAAAVESFVLKNPQLQSEFTLLQQTRLQPEVISYTGKEKLYRKERKGIRIRPLSFVRMAAAAAIVGVVYLSFVVMNKKENSADDMVITATNKPAKPASGGNSKDNNILEKPVRDKTVASLTNRKENRNSANYSRLNTRKQKKVNVLKLKEKVEATAVNVKRLKSVKQIPIESHDIASAPAPTQNSAHVNPEKRIDDFDGHIKPGVSTADEITNEMINEPLAKENPPLVTRAVYLETGDEEEKNVYIGSAEINKNKLKGLLKKAGVFLEKKLRRDDN